MQLLLDLPERHSFKLTCATVARTHIRAYGLPYHVRTVDWRTSLTCQLCLGLHTTLEAGRWRNVARSLLWFCRHVRPHGKQCSS